MKLGVSGKYLRCKSRPLHILCYYFNTLSIQSLPFFVLMSMQPIIPIRANVLNVATAGVIILIPPCLFQLNIIRYLLV